MTKARSGQLAYGFDQPQGLNVEDNIKEILLHLQRLGVTNTILPLSQTGKGF